MEIKIEVSRIHKLDGSGVTKAFVDLSIGDAFVIKGVRVIEGKQGLFVSMPQESGKDGKYYSVVVPLSREVKAEVDKVVLAAYEA